MSAASRILWFKAWTETRWFFGLGLAFLCASALSLYVGYPDDVATRFPNGAIAVRADEVRKLLQAGGHAYIWLSWFGTSLLLGLSCLALALGSTGIARSAEGHPAAGVTYALSMPVSRRKLVGVRVTAGLAELAVAAILPSILVCALARTQGQTFAVRQGLTHVLLAVCGVSAIYGLFVLLSVTLGELRKAVIGGALLFLYGAFTFLTNGFRRWSVFRLMTGDTYFERGEIPWPGVLLCLALAAAFLYASVRIVERRDF